MSLTVIAAGTLNASGGVQHTIHSISEAGIYQLLLDTSNMANGDVVEVSCRVMVTFQSGSEEHVFFTQVYAHAQADPVKISVPVTVPVSATFTLTQTDGGGSPTVGRSFEYSVVRIV